VPITTKVLSSNTTNGEVYSIQHYVIKFANNLRQVSGILRGVRMVPKKNNDKSYLIRFLNQFNKNVDIKFSVHNAFLE
jgi:predicted ATP-grasp superfamily ATP-dependent carboligase